MLSCFLSWDVSVSWLRPWSGVWVLGLLWDNTGDSDPVGLCVAWIWCSVLGEVSGQIHGLICGMISMDPSMLKPTSIKLVSIKVTIIYLLTNLDFCLLLCSISSMYLVDSLVTESTLTWGLSFEYLTSLAMTESLSLLDSLPVIVFLLVSLVRVELSWRLGLVWNILETGSSSEHSAESFMIGVLYFFMVMLGVLSGRGGGGKGRCRISVLWILWISLIQINILLHLLFHSSYQNDPLEYGVLNV